MTHQIKIPAVYMRGGTSKGVFFKQSDLPADPAIRDRMIQAVLGSPDAYGKQIDGMGGATSSTSKVAIINPSAQRDCDVDYLFGHIAVVEGTIDYSGNCSNLTAAMGVYAIEEGFVKQPDFVPNEIYEITVRIWQVNTQKKIIAYVPCCNGAPCVEGNYKMAGVANRGARMRLTFVDTAGAGGGGGVLPTGEVFSQLTIPDEFD